MDLKARQEFIRKFSKKYKAATKKEKGVILDKVVSATGYHRKWSESVLRNPPVKKVLKRRKNSKYTPVLPKLTQIWAVSNYASGKRLVSGISTYVEALTRHNELKVTKEEKRLLFKISPSTADRLLKRQRAKITLKGRSKTKPGSLLKSQIPIHTFSDWDNAKLGFTEIDLVHHNGISSGGEYIHTLDTVDVCTGWNECSAFMGRSKTYTLNAIKVARERLPFLLKGIDFDTGGEFVNWHLISYCKQEEITYTRAREGRKNDQAYVEQQNYSVVRRYVGYARLETWEQLDVLNQLYLKLSDYQNFFQPVMRLKEKVRDGAKVTKRYDKPKTAYQRILEHPDINSSTKRKLRGRFLKLNPKKLLLEITDLGKKLSRVNNSQIKTVHPEEKKTSLKVSFKTLATGLIKRLIVR